MSKKQLFESFTIRNTQIKNRVVVPPMVTFGWGDDTGFVQEDHVEHYRRLAAGGAGLVIVEATCITKEGRLSADQLGIWEDAHVEGLKKIADAIHENGSVALIQIHHAGVVGINEKPLCPDNYVLSDTVTGKKLTLEEVKEIQNAFIEGARRAYEAGFDGVELHGCHRYLLCQFLNSRVNQREDIYGKEPEKMVTEIMAGIRKKVSDDFIVGIRLGAFEPTLEDGIRHGKILVENGIDFLNISYGFASESDPYAPEGFPYQDIIYAAGEFKKNCDVPVFAVYGIKTGEQAQGVLEATDVDMVNIGRGMLADYNWANKVAKGEEVVQCFGCKSCQWRGNIEKCPGRRKSMK